MAVLDACLERRGEGDLKIKAGIEEGGR